MVLKLTDGREYVFPTAVHLLAQDNIIMVMDADYKVVCNLKAAQVQSVSWLKEPK